MIVVDTSILIDALTGPRRSADDLRAAVEAGERLQVPSIVLYEWLRGPRLGEELDAQEALFPSEETIPFGPAEAYAAADMSRSLGQPRGREVDIAIAAHARVRDVPLWTLNVSDFDDLPGVGLFAV